MKQIDTASYERQPEVGGHVEVYEDAAGQYRWRRVAGNGLIVGDSAGDGYSERNDCVEIAARLWGRRLRYYEVDD